MYNSTNGEGLYDSVGGSIYNHLDKLTLNLGQYEGRGPPQKKSTTRVPCSRGPEDTDTLRVSIITVRTRAEKID